MVAQRVCGRSMGIGSQCSLGTEIWRPWFVCMIIISIFLLLWIYNNIMGLISIIIIQFVHEPFEQVHYFCIGLLCLLLLFYLAQTIILPVRRISVHFCFIFCTLIVAVGTCISLSDKLQSRGLAAPTLIKLNKWIKHRRFIRYSLFLLLWFLALFCSYIGLVIFNLHVALHVAQ